MWSVISSPFLVCPKYVLPFEDCQRSSLNFENLMLFFKLAVYLNKCVHSWEREKEREHSWERKREGERKLQCTLHISKHYFETRFVRRNMNSKNVFPPQQCKKGCIAKNCPTQRYQLQNTDSNSALTTAHMVQNSDASENAIFSLIMTGQNVFVRVSGSSWCRKQTKQTE